MIKTEIRNVTPQWAEEILKRHDAAIQAGTFRQRRIMPKVVDRYAADMRMGNWALTGQGISFDEHDNLIDGQHRLLAVVKSGVTVKMLILWGVSEFVNSNQKVRSRDTIDGGKIRSLASQLQIEGIEYTQQISSASRVIALLCFMGSAKFTITNAQGIEIAALLKNQMMKVIEALNRNSTTQRARSFILAPLTLMRCFDPDTADLFATDYNEGVGLPKGSSVLAIKRFFERPLNMRGGTDFQIYASTAMASALYFYTNDKKVDNIRGNREHLEWLLKGAKNVVTKIREIVSLPPTVENLPVSQ